MEIKKVHFNPRPPEQKKVCAYARVSCEKDSMLHSLAAQVDYYSSVIRSHKGWEYVGVYADEAKTGTKDTRENFQRMMEDARSGKIDLIITKSVSRFARNTVTLLSAVRELKDVNVDVYFEEQNIHSLSADGELMLTILASFAQAESLSVSENMKWRVKKNFEEGIPWGAYMLGYRFEGDRLVVVPDEAEVVRYIFQLYLDGIGYNSIAKLLNNEHITTKANNTWSGYTVKVILKNYTYTGNLLLQQTYRQNYINKKKIRNNGELPKYAAENTHEAIIDIDTFNKAQELMKARTSLYVKTDTSAHYPLTGKIRCACCGKNYQRKNTSVGAKWMCSTYRSKGKSACASKVIPEDTLMQIVDDIGGLSAVEQITAYNGNKLEIKRPDGSVVERFWKDRSRSESWTDEMKEKAREKEYARLENERRKSLCQEM